MEKEYHDCNPRNKKVVQICEHCGMDIAIRNPSGYCDHLYYPDNCVVCKKREDEKEINIKLRKLIKAIRADFKELYQPRYTTDYKAKQTLINIELDIMSFENTKKLLSNF